VKIFVSYSRRDAGDFANQIQKHLSTFNYNIFTDVDSIPAGEIWSNTIEENISNCDIFVVIVTHGALQSPHVEKEVLQAQKEKKTIVPCFHSGARTRYMKWELNKIQGVEFTDEYQLARDLFLKIDIETIDKPQPGSNDTTTRGEIFADSYQRHLDIAKDFEDIGEYNRSLKQYEKVIEKFPDTFLLIYKKALFLERIKRYEEALTAIEQAIDIEPKNPDVWYHKGSILEKMKRYEEALTAINIDLRIDLNDVKSWTNKLRLLEQMERYEEALKTIDEILKIDSYNINALERKAKINEKSKRYNVAKDYFDCILDLQPNNLSILTNKARVLQKLGEYQEAIEIYDKILNSNQASLDFSDIDIALEEFYEDAINNVINKCKIKESDIRRWCQENLIGASQKRSILRRTVESTAGMRNQVIDILKNNYLIKENVHSGSKWYELSQARLIQAITSSNQKWNQKERQKYVAK
jgi:tetratricopeptide (TPR) repeat protein